MAWRHYTRQHKIPQCVIHWPGGFYRAFNYYGVTHDRATDEDWYIEPIDGRHGIFIRNGAEVCRGVVSFGIGKRYPSVEHIYIEANNE